MQKSIRFNHKELNLIVRSDADDSVFNEIFTDREYRMLDPIITAAKAPIIDIGAHTGYFSIYTKILNPHTQIFAYEPEETNFSTLKQNLKLNHIKDIKIKQLAVSDKTEPQKLYISPDSHNHSLIKEAKINPTATKTVQTTTLDNILKNTTHCDLIKMDCEGAEFRILSSTSPETFKKIEAFYIEYHEFSPSLKKETLTQILQKNGFTKTKTTPSHYEKTMGFIFATKKS